jgi:hypothetical protein
MRFPPFDDKEPPLDYGDNVLNADPLEAIQLDLDETEDGPIIEWLYDARPLVDTSHVNGPYYKYWSLLLPVMANLYRLGRTLLSDHTDINASHLFDIATPPLSTPYSARVACPKVHVRTNCALCWKACSFVMIRMGWPA